MERHGQCGKGISRQRSTTKIGFLENLRRAGRLASDTHATRHRQSRQETFEFQHITCRRWYHKIPAALVGIPTWRRMHDNLRKLHDVDDDDDLVEEEDVFRVQHHTLCLLRKADRSSIRYSHLNSRRHQVDAATGTTQTRILFQLPEHDDAKVEFWYSISFTNY